MIKKNYKEATLPYITFSIVTLNEEKRIRKCLEAIIKQNYPRKKIEIIVMDGGSKDNTISIAKEFTKKVYFNEKKLAEPGLTEAYRKAEGDYMVFMAADNIIYDKDWTKKMVRPFLDNPDSILASFSRVINDPQDNIWNKYMNEDAEPFSAFVFGNASHPEKFKKIYPIAKETNDYIIFDFDYLNFPLIALAQCTMLKTKLIRKKESQFDDILPLIDLIKEGNQIAYIKGTGIYHYSIKDFNNLCQKFNNRIKNSIQTKSYASREAYVSQARKIRRYLFLLYSLTLIFPMIDGVKMAIKEKKNYMLLHPVVSFIIGFYILYNFIRTKV